LQRGGIHHVLQLGSGALVDVSGDGCQGIAALRAGEVCLPGDAIGCRHANAADLQGKQRCAPKPVSHGRWVAERALAALDQDRAEGRASAVIEPPEICRPTHDE